MRLAPVFAVAVLFMTFSVRAQDSQAIVATARQRIEATDSRATGRLVRVDASGKRISNSFAIKMHWFPGVLRALIEISPSKTPEGSEPPATHQEIPQETHQETNQDQRISILLEMRPKGQNTIRIFRPHESTPTSLPFDKWNQSVFGSDFDYEDFLQPEYYWQGQTIVKSAKIGARDCDVLKSTPGASDRSHYAEVQTWLDHTIGYPIYIEKTSKDAGSVKEFTSLGLTQSSGVWAARQLEVKIHGRAGSTLLMIERGSAKANLTLKDFSPEQISKFEDHP